MDKLQQGIFALSANDIVDIRGLERLCRQERGVPSTQDDGEVRIPLFDGSRNFNRFPDHRSGHKRDTKAEGVTHFFEYALFVVWSDRRINEANLIAGTKQWRRNRQDTQGRRRIGTSERREKENNFAGLWQRI